MQLIHEMYSDYERLLHANPQRGYDFFYSTLLNPSLREPMLTGEASLQAIFCGCNEKGQAIFPNAYNINDLLVDEDYMDQALGNYLAFLGYANPGNDWATFLKNNYAAIFADKAALAAVLQSKTAMQLFVTDSTLWSAILASTTHFRRCMCSYYFCAQLAVTPTKFADIRSNSAILTAFNTGKIINLATSVHKAPNSMAYFVMIIGQGGTGGSGGYRTNPNCNYYYYDATSGGTGYNSGAAGKPRYAYTTSSTGKDQNAGGGGGRGGVTYCAIRVLKAAEFTCNIQAVPSISGFNKQSVIGHAANNTQGQILPDINTSSDSTSGTNTSKGYGGYGYGTAASGNNLLGTISGTAGTAGRNTSKYGQAGAGGSGVGAGGGGGGNAVAYSSAQPGGAGASGCIGLYVGA